MAHRSDNSFNVTHSYGVKNLHLKYFFVLSPVVVSGVNEPLCFVASTGWMEQYSAKLKWATDEFASLSITEKPLSHLHTFINSFVSPSNRLVNFPIFLSLGDAFKQFLCNNPSLFYINPHGKRLNKIPSTFAFRWMAFLSIFSSSVPYRLIHFPFCLSFWRILQKINVYFAYNNNHKRQSFLMSLLLELFASNFYLSRKKRSSYALCTLQFPSCRIPQTFLYPHQDACLR